MRHDDTMELVEQWLGLPYSAMRCYDLVARAYALRGVSLPADYMGCLPMFRTVREPEAWDLVAIKNHAIVTNHVGLMVTPYLFIHSMEDVGVTIGDVRHERWAERIAGFLRLRERFQEN